ncbi:hypothetical protein EV129_10193 [Rhizobium azibense]|nr:hypothetical protein EV129_10193 [Rhizobium azibense]
MPGIALGTRHGNEIAKTRAKVHSPSTPSCAPVPNIRTSGSLAFHSSPTAISFRLPTTWEGEYQIADAQANS